MQYHVNAIQHEFQYHGILKSTIVLPFHTTFIEMYFAVMITDFKQYGTLKYIQNTMELSYVQNTMVLFVSASLNHVMVTILL